MRFTSEEHIETPKNQPTGMLAAGPLADRVFEPAMVQGGNLASMFGGLVGIGAGAGMILMFVFAGFFGLLVGFDGYAFHEVRNAEDILPDYDNGKKENSDLR